MAFQPPSLMFSSRIIGDVRVIVTCILGSTHEFKIIAASDEAHFMSYFSGLITYIRKSTRNLVGPFTLSDEAVSLWLFHISH